MSEKTLPPETLTTADHVVGLCEDHLDLLQLEWNFERSLAGKNMLKGLWLVVSALAVLLFTHIGLFALLLHLGMTTGWICLLFIGIYGVSAAIAWKQLQRDPKLGDAFEGTSAELRGTLRWMRHFLS